MARFYLFTIVILAFQMFFPGAYAQRKAITGDIIDSVTGKKISNVNIFESMAGVGTITNPSGSFRLMLNQGAVQISVSVNGYKTWMKEFVLQTDTVMKISLQPLKDVNLVTAGNNQDDSKNKEAGTSHGQRHRHLN